MSVHGIPILSGSLANCPYGAISYTVTLWIGIVRLPYAHTFLSDSNYLRFRTKSTPIIATNTVNMQFLRFNLAMISVAICISPIRGRIYYFELLYFCAAPLAAAACCLSQRAICIRSFNGFNPFSVQ